MSCNGIKILPKLPKPMISTIDKHSCLILVHLNISGIQSKILDIQNDETLKLAHVLCFNETHLSKSQTVTTEMLGFQDNYEIYQKDRNQNGGGVMLLVHKSLNPQHILTVCSMEVVIIQITVSKEPLYIISVYRSQQYKINNWINDIKQLLNLYKNNKICILGDVNEDLLSHLPKPILTMFTTNGLTQHIRAPTHDSGTLIDHLYTSNALNTHVKTEVLDYYYSDHDIVTCTISNHT